MTDGVKIGDAVVHEVLNPGELQHLLREVGGPQLSGVVVTTPSALEPWIVTVGGAIAIYGDVHYWEATGIDMRGLTSADDILAFCAQLNEMFDKGCGSGGEAVMDFVPYPKTPRLRRDVVLTEKIDGSNAQVVITRGGIDSSQEIVATWQITPDSPDVVGERLFMRVGSRTRWITPGKDTDNFGFAAWCRDNATELFKLGEGQHFGEWYGAGIQRGYGLDHKRFALFNTARWGKHNPNTPACAEVVPLLYVGALTDVDDVVKELRHGGSVAVPGFPAEGVIVYHTASKQSFKVLLDNDELPKGLVEAV
jgi:hypothetical protein